MTSPTNAAYQKNGLFCQPICFTGSTHPQITLLKSTPEKVNLPKQEIKN